MKRYIYLNKELSKIPDVEYEYLGDNRNDERKKYPSLTPENIKRVHDYVTTRSSYSSTASDNFVAKYFSDHKGDVSLSSVITKVILIDTVDSTNLKPLLGKNYYLEIANRIINSRIEDKIAEGKVIGETFKEIANIPIPTSKIKKKSDYNLFIFTSKYITRVNEYSYAGNSYSIMDTVVKDYLPIFEDHFNKKQGNDIAMRLTTKSLNQMHDEFDYDGYCKLLGDMVSKIGDGVNRNMLDHFLWFSFKKEAAEEK